MALKGSPPPRPDCVISKPGPQAFTIEPQSAAVVKIGRPEQVLIGPLEQVFIGPTKQVFQRRIFVISHSERVRLIKPRVTPWVRRTPEPSNPERVIYMDGTSVEYRSPFQGSFVGCIFTQGVTLGFTKIGLSGRKTHPWITKPMNARSYPGCDLISVVLDGTLYYYLPQSLQAVSISSL